MLAFPKTKQKLNLLWLDEPADKSIGITPIVTKNPYKERNKNVQNRILPKSQ